MASTASRDMKGFYRQKKSGGITKGKTSKASTSKKQQPKNAASFGSDVAQTPALISHGALDINDGYDENESVLRQFDMNMAYGPCLGMDRLARWERAQKLGLNPPKEVEALVREGKVGAMCLWDGRV
ncbi:DNA polymerase delta, subunit 4 [Dillenia turbinata]|uniref:DNA polymerase delta, subunit 4 n=1 Tax=Dillenia turbinata TaxID=194707 RepID=A0AAN8VBB8_9MAGN